jgi:hypothetical protein
VEGDGTNNTVVKLFKALLPHNFICIEQRKNVASSPIVNAHHNIWLYSSAPKHFKWKRGAIGTSQSFTLRILCHMRIFMGSID